MANLKFLKDFKKDVEKTGAIVGALKPPRYWFSTGNYALNKIISGSFLRGIPQGRIIGLSGPSMAGKSFLSANILREAQQAGAHAALIDSEHDKDNDFIGAIGVNVEDNYTYVDVNTIPQAKKVVSSFITSYNNTYGDDPDAPKVIMVIDSLDMLLSEAEADQFLKGVTKGDMGQRNKQLKSMLRSFVQAISRLNISMIITSQVYRNQDLTNGEGMWIISDAVKYSLSQIVLLTKLKLKDKETSTVDGIRMKCEGYKTRFTKPYQTVTIEVPYETGMDPYNGLLKVAIDMGVCEKKGSRCVVTGEDKSWYAKDFGKVASRVLEKCEEHREQFLDVLLEDEEIDLTPQLSSRKRRQEASKDNDTK